MTPAEVEECRAVNALLLLANRLDGVEAAALPAIEPGEVDGEALRIARDHNIDPTRITAYRSLARARGLTLEQVLRAAFRGELREVVQLPDVRTKVRR